jgi:integrase
MPLTHTVIVNAQPREKMYRLFDGSGGLYLEVTPRGGKWWRVKYRLARCDQRLSVGVFPVVGLKLARLRCMEVRAQLAAGLDPSALRKAAKLKPMRKEETFEAIAREWHASLSWRWTDSYGDRILRRLEAYVFPWLGRLPVTQVKAIDILECLRRLEHQNTCETARRVLQSCGQVLRYAILTNRAETDVSRHLCRALVPRKGKHAASIRNPKEVAALMRAIDGYDGRLITKFALRLAPLVFVRPGELRHATWDEFDFIQQEWRIPAGRMKARQPHIVPLSRQALSLLRELQPLTGDNHFLFPGERATDQPMSDNTLNAALRRLGYGKDQMTAHGFRAMASTLLNELGWSSDAIERQLAHGERKGSRAVYNYAQYLPEREEMMQGWADYLDHLRGQVHTDRGAWLPSGEMTQSQTDDVRSWLGPMRVALRSRRASRLEVAGPYAVRSAIASGAFPGLHSRSLAFDAGADTSAECQALIPAVW